MIPSLALSEYAGACKEFSFWYNRGQREQQRPTAGACKEFSFWYNKVKAFISVYDAGACKEFSFWYNLPHLLSPNVHRWGLQGIFVLV